MRRRRALSPSRAQVLDLVRRNRDGVTLSAIARFTGLHENTVRGHLEALRADDQVERTRGEPAGRGRPPWVWSPRASTDDSGGYAGLASALARTIAEHTDDADRLAMEAGRTWGRSLGHGATGSGDVVADVATLMRSLDYEPRREPGSTTINLHACPLLDAATAHPEVVCTVHHGLVRGALEAHGAADHPSSLEPFAAPGTCVLRIGPDHG